MTTSVIEVNDIRKYYKVEKSLGQLVSCPWKARKEICALEGISFSVGSGEILGVVGPNGAGKTTLLRILADLLCADSGEVSIDGYKLNNGPQNVRNRIGYISSDERSFFWRLTGRQNLDFFARLYGVAGRKHDDHITSMLDEFGLREKSRQLFRDYSAGTRKKFAVIRALVHRPRVVLLDEVTNSLDPQTAQQVKSSIRNYVGRRTGRVGVWSTHRLEEISQICDKVITIKAGRAEFVKVVTQTK